MRHSWKRVPLLMLSRSTVDGCRPSVLSARLDEIKASHLITRSFTVLISIGLIGTERVKDLVHKETILNLR